MAAFIELRGRTTAMLKQMKSGALQSAAPRDDMNEALWDKQKKDCLDSQLERREEKSFRNIVGGRGGNIKSWWLEKLKFCVKFI